MVDIARLSHDLPPFHDGRPIHTHLICSHCLVFQRDSGAKLSRCAACSSAFYCSKKCQVDAWPTHKSECKLAKQQAAAVAALTGLTSAYADLLDWIRYYEAPLKNCAVAAFRVRTNPHAERTSIMCVELSYKGAAAANLPVQLRFTVRNVGLKSAGDFPAGSTLREMDASHPAYRSAVARGKIEMGAQFYGTGCLAVLTQFAEMLPPVPNVKMFAIDRETAFAKPTERDCWELFREYVNVGAKLRFCCGRVRGASTCCCGGWVHDEEKKRAFKEA
ncbi:hypothetical protein MKEN_01323400 [Mycena kentingensis (nom. inval.)]|nr:hypothetical protein MKEN_01323400 [Mycena kentingensis (nom. inval.)]